MSNEANGKQTTPGLVQVFFSVMASFFGVQSNRKREEDFKSGKSSHYIIIGLVVTVIFVLTIWGVVSLVMQVAAG